MKNLLTIFLLVFMAQIFAQTNQPQTIVSKPCACGSWNPLVLRQTNGTMKYECGSRIEWSCNRPFQFTTSYQCSPSDANCQAKTTWDVRNGSVIIKSGTGTNNISDGFTLTANGSYTLTLNASCNGIKCPPCTYTIIIKDCLNCDCGTWGPLVLRQPTGPMKYECGSKIEWSCNRPFQFTSSYQCNPSDASCQAKTTWDVRNGEVIIKSGTGTNSLSDGFSLTANGNYTLTLNASCNGIKCPPCTYIIIIKDCVTCDCGKWTPIVINRKSYDCGSKIPWIINQPVYFATSYQCSPENESCQAKTSWELKKDGVIIKTVSAANSINDSFTPTANGTYTLTLNASCNGKVCPPCIVTFVIDKVTASCDCGSWSGKPIKYESTATKTSPFIQGTIKCNESFTLPMGAYTFTAPDYNCSSGDCITYDWIFSTPSNYTLTQRGINSLPLDFNSGYYGGYGTYTINIYAKCGGKSCGTCEFKVVVNKTTTTKSMSTLNTNTDNPPSKTITRNWIAGDTTKIPPYTVSPTPTLSLPGNSIPVAHH